MGFFVFCLFRFLSGNVAAEFSVFLFCRILRPVDAGACSFNRNKKYGSLLHEELILCLWSPAGNRDGPFVESADAKYFFLLLIGAVIESGRFGAGAERCIYNYRTCLGVFVNQVVKTVVVEYRFVVVVYQQDFTLRGDVVR